MTVFEGYQAIEFERHGRRLDVFLNRPDKLNATDEVLHEELARVFVDCANDTGSDVIVLSGRGRAFSAGGDLTWMQDAVDEPIRFEKTVREARQIIDAILACNKPIIAKLNGHATGLGATIALFCDIIYAADVAKIGDPHVSIGLVAGDGGAVIWPQLIGYARAKEYLLTGDLMTAAEAERIGLINRVFSPDALDAAVAALADRLLSGARISIQGTKASINIGLRQLVSAVMDASLAYESMSNASADHREAVAAFRERRPAAFTGR